MWGGMNWARESADIPHTHTHTHTHVGFYGLRGLSIGVMFLYCTSCMCYCPTPTLHLNLALTGDGAFLLSLKKTHSVWFISVLNYGDTENVLINHLLLVIPMLYPCHYTNLCPHKPHKHAHTHTHTNNNFKSRCEASCFSLHSGLSAIKNKRDVIPKMNHREQKHKNKQCSQRLIGERGMSANPVNIMLYPKSCVTHRVCCISL